MAVLAVSPFLLFIIPALPNLLYALIPDVIVYNQFPIYQVKNEGYLKNRHSSLLIFGTERPSETSQVLFRRDPDTGLGKSLPGDSLVRMVEPFSASSEYSKVALFLPIADGFYSNTGAYSVSLRDQDLRIIALKIPDQAPLKPTMFTKTVFEGDTVNLEIRIDTSHYNYTAPIIWRHNGKVLKHWSSQTEVIHSAIKSDEGVYEFYQSELERAWGKIGLLRLIVNDCDPLMWGKTCGEHCPICFNGGVCDHKQLGECICPPGFKGKYCEQACDESWFDAGCSSRCGSPDEYGRRSCSSYLLCLQDPYGCSCASGFYGIHCNDECEAGFFGVECSQTCHCANGEACNAVTGHCPNGCELGYVGDSCQFSEHAAVPLFFANKRTNPGQATEFVCALQLAKRPSPGDCIIQAPDGTTSQAAETSFLGRNYPYKWTFFLTRTQQGSYNCIYKGNLVAYSHIKFFDLPSLRKGAKAVEVGSSHVLLSWNSWERFYDRGDGPIKEYELFLIDNGQKEKKIATVEHLSLESEVEYNVSGLDPFSNYTFFIRTTREGFHGTGPPSPRLTVTTKCDLARLSMKDPEILAAHSDRLLYRWEVSPCASMLGSPHTKYQFHFSTSSTFNTNTRDGLEVGSTHVENNLEPFTDYYFRVRASLTNGVKGQWSHTVKARTREAQASKPTNFRVLCSDSDSITVSWDAPEMPRGLIHSYDVSYDKSFDAMPPSSLYGSEGIYGMGGGNFAPDLRSKSQQFITQEVQGSQHDNFDLRIDKLHPNTTYYFRVRAKNGFGAGSWSSDIVARTEFTQCPTKAAFSLAEPAAANLAVIAAIFVGVILTITIIIVAAIGYFGISCNPSASDGELDRHGGHKAGGHSYVIGTGGHGSRNAHSHHSATALTNNHLEMLDKTYLANSDCGFRLSNYHHETDSLINEAMGSPSRDCSADNLTLPGPAPVVTHRGASPNLGYGTTTRQQVRHAPGKITRVPVGPDSLDLPDFFERRPDGHDGGNVGVAGFETMHRKRKDGACEKKLSFADQISVRIRDKHVDPSQHDESNNSSIRSDCCLTDLPSPLGGIPPPHSSPCGSIQGILIDVPLPLQQLPNSRPPSTSPPPPAFLKQGSLPHPSHSQTSPSLHTQLSNDSSCLIVTPTDNLIAPPSRTNTFGLPLGQNGHQTLGGHGRYSPQTFRSMSKQRSIDSQTFLQKLQ